LLTQSGRFFAIIGARSASIEANLLSLKNVVAWFATAALWLLDGSTRKPFAHQRAGWRMIATGMR
jgi:hypothetical protein